MYSMFTKPTMQSVLLKLAPFLQIKKKKSITFGHASAYVDIFKFMLIYWLHGDIYILSWSDMTAVLFSNMIKLCIKFKCLWRSTPVYHMQQYKKLPHM